MSHKIPDCIEPLLPEKEDYLLLLPTGRDSLILPSKQVFVTIRKKKLKIFTDDKHLLGTIEFDKLSLKINIDDSPNFQPVQFGNQPSQKLISESLPTKFTILVFTQPNPYTFQCRDHENLLSWVTVLSAHWRSSNSPMLGNQIEKNLTSAYQKKFMETIKRPDKITKMDLTLTADSGDLLLFAANTWFAGVQRSVTQSNYDHVAFILRYADSRLVYFESTANTGVALYSWD